MNGFPLHMKVKVCGQGEKVFHIIAALPPEEGHCRPRYILMNGLDTLPAYEHELYGEWKEEKPTMSEIKVGDIVRFTNTKHDKDQFEVIKKRQTWSKELYENEITYWRKSGGLLTIAENDDIVKVEAGQ